MKIGCLSWCFHSFAGGTNPEEAIETIGELGFAGTELIVLSPAELTDYWNDTTLDRLRRQLERLKLEVAQFVLFQPVVGGLTSPDAAERERSLDYFEAGCRIGQKLGAPLLNIVAPWSQEIKGPYDYLPRYYEIPNPKPGEKFHLDIAPGFDWDRVWNSYREVTRACLERVKAYGMKLSVEHHTHTIIPDATAFMRLWDDIRDPALGFNMDVGWTLSQREYPPLAIHKVRDHLMNLHMRDIDGLMRQFVPFGEGVMDYQAIAEALKTVGYEGYLSIEQDKHRPEEMKDTCRRYLNLMREALR